MLFQEDSESDHEPPIDEDCEIEEDLEPAMESIKFSRGNKKSLKPNLCPGDTIVLEFAPSSDNKSKLFLNSCPPFLVSVKQLAIKICSFHVCHCCSSTYLKY